MPVCRCAGSLVQLQIDLDHRRNRRSHLRPESIAIACKCEPRRADPSRKTLRLGTIKEEIVTTAAAQLNPLLIVSARIELLAKVQRLDDEARRLTAEIPILKERLAVKADELEALDRSMAALTF